MNAAEASPLAPIFVVGAPRSGTTLTATILGRHPLVFSIGETHFYEDVWSRRGELGELSEIEGLRRGAERLLTIFGRFNFPAAQQMVASSLTAADIVARATALGGGYAGLYAAFMGLLAEAAGKPRWCDDTPKHLFYLPAILAHFPAAKVIVCVRDPRDFLCSYKNYWRRSTESDRIKALYHPILTGLVWRSSANAMLAYQAQFGPERLLCLQYERLVAAPHAEIQCVCDFLGLAWTPAMLDVTAHNSSFADSGAGIFTGSVGRWRTGLDPAEAWWAQRVAGRGLAAFGYQPEPIRPAVGAWLRIFSAAPFALARALWANRYKRGPLGVYLARRLAAIFGRN